MINFQYQLQEHTIEFQASCWIGWEKVLLDGKIVSYKFNMAPCSEHKFKLDNGAEYKLKTLIEPDTQLLICRLYAEQDNNSQHICSLKQGVSHQKYLQKRFYQWFGLALSLAVLMILFQD